MRIDEIDLIGTFTINGLSPQTDQFLGLSGGDLAWLDPAPSQSGFSIYGNRYVYCNSVEGNQVSSGTNLKNAYASASAFIVSATARGAVLVSPGVYDFNNSPLNLTASYIDIVGISSDANSVLLKATNADYTLKYWQGVDSGLFNVGITGGNILGILGSASTYLRWDNIIVNGDCFYESTTPKFAFENLNGEFKNITLRDYSHFGFGYYSIDGIYDNIQGNTLGDVFYADVNGISRGTFSNISFGTFSNLFNISGTFSGSIRNVKLGSGTSFLSSNGTIIAEVEKVEMNDLTGNCFYSDDLLIGNFNDIKIRDASPSSIFFSSETNGTFENIKIGNSTYVFETGNSDLLGTFSNIEVGNVDSFIRSVTSINGNFSNIKVGNITTAIFSADSDLYGNFDNIEFGTGNGGSAFSAGYIISGTFSNIKSVGDVGMFAVSNNGGSLSGKFSNIEVGYSPNFSQFKVPGNISGEFYDINFQDVSDIFTANDYLQGTFKNITVGTVSIEAFVTLGTMSGTFSNIKIGNVGVLGAGDAFDSAHDMSGTFENIEVGDVSQNFFDSGGNVDLVIDGLKVGSVASYVFRGVDLKATIKNVDIKDATTAFYYVGTSDMYCTIDNLTIGDCKGGPLVHFDGDLYGTFSNFKTNNSGDTFENSAPVISLNMKNIDLGTCSHFLPNGTSAFGNRVLIDNLNVKQSYPVSDFDGTIRNSRIEMLVPNRSALLLIGGDSSIIERCVLLSTGTWSIGSGGSTPEISFTRASGGIQPTITNNLGSALEAKNILQ